MFVTTTTTTAPYYLSTVTQIILCILRVNNNMRIHCSITQTFSHVATRAKLNLCLIITILGKMYFISNVIVLKIKRISLFYSAHIYCSFFSIFSLPFIVSRTFHLMKINISSTLSCTSKLCTKIVCEYIIVLCFFLSFQLLFYFCFFLLSLVSLIVYNYFTWCFSTLMC